MPKTTTKNVCNQSPKGARAQGHCGILQGGQGLGSERSVKLPIVGLISCIFFYCYCDLIIDGDREEMGRGSQESERETFASQGPGQGRRPRRLIQCMYEAQ